MPTREYKSSLRDRLRAKKWYRDHVERAKETARLWALNHPENVRRSRVKRKDRISEGKKRWYTRNRKHSIGKAVEWSKKNRNRRREISRDSARKRQLDRFGLSVTVVRNLLLSQSGACKICKLAFGKTTPCLDPCHKTGDFRGLLCQKCNAGLGMFRDSPGLLQEAIYYLKEQAHV